MKKSETAELNFQQQGRTELERNYKDTVFVTVFHEKEKLSLQLFKYNSRTTAGAVIIEYGTAKSACPV